jgi:hypothetical protein
VGTRSGAGVRSGVAEPAGEGALAPVVAPLVVLAASPGTATPGLPEVPVGLGVVPAPPLAVPELVWPELGGPELEVPEPPLAVPELAAGSGESPGAPSVTADGLA